jgi:Holliday junction resolvase
MGRKSRDKGARAELEVVAALKALGISSEKIPGSGSFRYRGEAHDVSIHNDDGDQSVEVKIRATGFKQIYDYLGDNDLLFLRRDRDRWLVVMDIDTWHKERQRS